MRLLGIINNEKAAQAFTLLLKNKNIAHHVDVHTNTDWGSLNYGLVESKIWINEEDQVPEALKWFELLKNNPNDPLFSSPAPIFMVDNPNSPANLNETFSTHKKIEQKQTKQSLPWDKQPMGWITRLLLITCSFLLIFSEMLTPKITSQSNANFLSIYTSPIDKALIYDYPHRYDLIDRFIQLYGTDETHRKIPADGQVLLNAIKAAPVWQGIYPLLTSKEGESIETELKTTPIFEKISQGQFWRLFTPALLHADIFHLFFNMLWLIVLGKQIEQHLAPLRYIILVLLLGIFSNTMQYLASGPNFIGFSGVLCGMLTFIWARQGLAPWEGYELNRMTYLFMMVFIIGMAVLQFLSFFAEKSFGLNISLNVANMAHLSGAFLGYLLGRTNIFSWRHS